MSNPINKNVNVERRTWDKETYEARARSRAEAEADADATHKSTNIPISGAATTSSEAGAISKAINPTEEKEEFLTATQGRAGPMGSQRAFLKSRSKKVDLESKLGTSEIIDPSAAAATKSNLSSGPDAAGALTPSSGVSKCTDGVGWHCRVCDCFLKDSLTYLDHINGRKHQRYLGYTMRVEKSTTEEVNGLLKGLAEKKREKEREKGIGGLGVSGVSGGNAASSGGVIDFEEAVRAKDEEALRRKAERARRREERKKRDTQETNNNNVYYVEQQVEEVPEGQNDEEKENEEEEEEEENGGIDPSMAAMMGFSGFGGSRK